MKKESLCIAAGLALVISAGSASAQLSSLLITRKTASVTAQETGICGSSGPVTDGQTTLTPIIGGTGTTRTRAISGGVDGRSLFSWDHVNDLTGVQRYWSDATIDGPGPSILECTASSDNVCRITTRTTQDFLFDGCFFLRYFIDSDLNVSDGYTFDVDIPGFDASVVPAGGGVSGSGSTLHVDSAAISSGRISSPIVPVAGDSPRFDVDFVELRQVLSLGPVQPLPAIGATDARLTFTFATPDIVAPIGILDVDDIDAFIQAYVNGDCVADLDGSSWIDQDDADLFFRMYDPLQTGCSSLAVVANDGTNFTSMIGPCAPTIPVLP